MTKKTKKSKKATRSSKRTEITAQPDDEHDTATITAPADVLQATPATSEAKVPVESQQAAAADVPAALATEAPKVIRSETAKANIKEGLKQHALAGRPTKAQLIFVFGTKGYAMTWARRTASYGITPETFQAALAKGVPAIPLAPVAEQSKKS